MSNAARFFFSLWYFGGCLIHIYLSLFNPRGYTPFGSRAIIPVERELWTRLVMPRIRFFALLLAAFELLVGVLMLSKGPSTKLGFVLSILFNLFLAQLGLGMPGEGLKGEMWNRLPTGFFAVAQLPLLWIRFDRTFTAAFSFKK